MSSNFDLADLIGEGTLQRPGGATVATSTLAGKVVALYFSAHWCGPCRAFTPVLSAAYESAKAAGLPFEVVFVSSDSDEDAFDEYSGSMPWSSVQFAEDERREALKAAFGCKGIPQLSVLEPTPNVAASLLQFSLITHQGKAQLAKDKEKVIAEWCAEAAAQGSLSASVAAAPVEAAKPAGDAFSMGEDF